MSNKEIIESALQLSFQEKLFIVDSILRSPDEPDKEIEEFCFKNRKKS